MSDLINSNNNNVQSEDTQRDMSSEPMLLTRSGDSIDARSFLDVLRGRSNSLSPLGQLTTQVDSLSYNMRHRSRGKCIIINNKSFDYHTRLNERKGTEMDGKALYACFRSLDFDVFIYNDASSKDIITVLENASKENHSQNDCIVVCILTHGEQGVLWARDEKYNTDAVFSFFKGDQCPTLAGKPKIFFIQACQGDKLDAGVALHRNLDVTDSGNNYYRIPNYADFLIAYSTVPGFYSWRNTSQGSWFIQALIEVLGKYSSHMHLQDMLTIVSRKVAYDFESNVPNDQEFHQKKQIPCVTSMLTRLIYFSPKV